MPSKELGYKVAQCADIYLTPEQYPVLILRRSFPIEDEKKPSGSAKVHAMKICRFS